MSPRPVVMVARWREFAEAYALARYLIGLADMREPQPADYAADPFAFVDACGDRAGLDTVPDMVACWQLPREAGEVYRRTIDKLRADWRAYALGIRS